MGYFDDCKEDAVAVHLSEGEYGARIELTIFDMAKTPAVATIKYKITKTNIKGAIGREVWSNFRMEHPSKAFFFKTMNLLGKDAGACKTIEDVADMLHSLKGRECEVFVKLTPKKNNPDEFWENTYCNGPLNPAKFTHSNDPVADAVSGDVAFDANDEIPF